MHTSYLRCITVRTVRRSARRIFVMLRCCGTDDRVMSSVTLQLAYPVCGPRPALLLLFLQFGLAALGASPFSSLVVDVPLQFFHRNLAALTGHTSGSHRRRSARSGNRQDMEAMSARGGVPQPCKPLSNSGRAIDSTKKQPASRIQTGDDHSLAAHRVEQPVTVPIRRFQPADVD